METKKLERPQRWDEPFDPRMTDDDVKRILVIPPFNRMDPDQFPERLSLHDILHNDTAIRSYRLGDIVVSEGDYGNSAFFVLGGSVSVVIEKLPPSILGRREHKRKSFGKAIAQLWSNHLEPEVRDVFKFLDESRVSTSDDEKDTRIFLQDVPEIIEKFKTVQIAGGGVFGEIAALGRTPRTATVLADDETELLEIRWQGLRDLMRYAKELKEYVDKLYRDRSLKVHLQETPIFKHLTETDLNVVSKQTIFETYGEFDWYGSYKSLLSESATERLENEPIIAEEGNYPNGLVMIRSGFARLSKKFGNGHRTSSYLGRGHIYGFDEIFHNWRYNTQISRQYTLRAIGYVDVLIVPTSTIERFVLGPDRESPLIPPELHPSPIKIEKELVSRTDVGSKIGDDMLEFLVENRYINGAATMMINLDRCTRCDDCVRACADSHDNNPKFIRHGPQIGNYMIANACMHCADPVCMIGCPTGAIYRDLHGGQVVINDMTCIGCSMCANSCPYHNIRMVEIRDDKGGFILDQNTHVPILKATKCDLCIDQMGGPACQRACPHDALVRIDIQGDPDLLAKWINR